MTSKIEIVMSDSAANEILAGLGFDYKCLACKTPFFAASF